jgi:hypothetical protein
MCACILCPYPIRNQKEKKEMEENKSLCVCIWWPNALRVRVDDWQCVWGGGYMHPCFSFFNCIQWPNALRVDDWQCVYEEEDTCTPVFSSLPASSDPMPSVSMTSSCNSVPLACLHLYVCVMSCVYAEEDTCSSVPLAGLHIHAYVISCMCACVYAEEDTCTSAPLACLHLYVHVMSCMQVCVDVCMCTRVSHWLA